MRKENRLFLHPYMILSGYVLAAVLVGCSDAPISVPTGEVAEESVESSDAGAEELRATTQEGMNETPPPALDAEPPQSEEVPCESLDLLFRDWQPHSQGQPIIRASEL